MTSALWLHLAFFGSGVSGLIYQVVWVRQFGQIYGNTVYSASIVVAIFMLGLGAGSYAFGVLADRAADTSRLVRLYAWLEVLIGILGAAISFALPHLAAIVAALSSYETGADGWHTLSTVSYARPSTALRAGGPRRIWGSALSRRGGSRFR